MGSVVLGPQRVSAVSQRHEWCDDLTATQAAGANVVRVCASLPGVSRQWLQRGDVLSQTVLLGSVCLTVTSCLRPQQTVC